MSNRFDENFSIGLQQNLHWGDMDAFEHINNAVYFRYFEDIRMKFFETVGINEYKKQHNIGPILASTHCNFKSPLTYPDTINITTRHTVLSPKKIKMEYFIFSQKNTTLAAEGEGLIIYYDYALHKSCEIPQDILDAMSLLK